MHNDLLTSYNSHSESLLLLSALKVAGNLFSGPLIYVGGLSYTQLDEADRQETAECVANARKCSIIVWYQTIIKSSPTSTA